MSVMLALETFNCIGLLFCTAPMFADPISLVVDMSQPSFLNPTLSVLNRHRGFRPRMTLTKMTTMAVTRRMRLLGTFIDGKKTSKLFES